MKCPGQDTRYWKPGDIFDVRCPGCGRDVEFFRDDAERKCGCGRVIPNPKLDLACAERAPATFAAGPHKKETNQLPERIQPETAGHDRITLEMTLEEPQVRIDVEFRDDLALAVLATGVDDPGNPIGHQHVG